LFGGDVPDLQLTFNINRIIKNNLFSIIFIYLINIIFCFMIELELCKITK